MSEAIEFNPRPKQIKDYFRRFLPVVIDVETGGFNAEKHALLEIAVIFLKIHDEGLCLDNHLHLHIEPFEHSAITEASKNYIGFNLDSNQVRWDESEAMQHIVEAMRKRIKSEDCTRAILVGHNAQFDLAFVNAALQRHNLKSPLHQFSTLDTVTVSAITFGHTVLSQACEIAGLTWDNQQAHCALYDCQQTARLFCKAVNLIRSSPQ